MAKTYRPSTPFNAPMWLFVPTMISAKGSRKYVYPETGEKIFCSFKTYGGTETIVNGVLSVEMTAVIETWYRPDITSKCELEDTSGNRYEILGIPEDIDQRHQFFKFKIRLIKGGA